MFRAKNVTTGADVIILDHVDEAAVDALRTSSRADQLRCPVCNQPVSVKAGEVNVWHFAHKHLADCPSQSEPPELLLARATLYRWLRSKFGDGVTVEKVVEGGDLPRHVDCWVVTPTGRRLAYWLIDRQMRPDDRLMLPIGFQRAEATPVFVFLSQLMQRNGKPKDILNLTTTERELIRPSEYDFLYLEFGRGMAGSLHYLDAAGGTLATFRALGCTEPPQEYTGHEIATPLSHLQVRPSNGEFVHPGEPELLRSWREREAARRADEERRRREAEGRAAETARRAEERRRADEEAWERARQERLRREVERHPQAPLPPTAAPLPPASVKPPARATVSAYENREGVCEICGQRTRDWWTYSGLTGLCKCNECLRAGRSA